MRRCRIRLSAGHEGNHIVIAIEDDGKGIDPEKIKAKAVEKGVLTPQEAAEMTDTESYNLIFAPGFSMAKKLTSVSGRGVGMDVVKTNITKLNGIITVESEVGKGSRFTLKLPLTLAIIQGLLVNVGDETFAVPLSSVLEVVRTSRSDLSYIQGREMIRLRDRILPLVHVDDLLHVPGSKNKTSDRFYTVVIGVANSFFGLVVDSLLGQKEIVIKTLGTFLKSTQGIAGSTILGDGRVIMILDVGEIAKLMKNKIGYEA
ncbi:MAG: chemotaxis protein CheW [Calditrichia bacterium]